MKNWYVKNLRKTDGRFDTSRAMQFLCLTMIFTFTIYFGLFFVKGTYKLIMGINFKTGDMVQLAGSAVALFASVIVPMWSYRKKENGYDNNSGVENGNE